MSAKITYIILGVSLILIGVMMIIDPIFYSTKYNYTWDFTEVKWPLGCFLVILGSYFLVSNLKKKAQDYEERVLMCPKCIAPFNHSAVPNKNCPDCGTQLENLEGFYERHPDLRTK